MRNPIIILAGPTASGKSQLALTIAKDSGAVIINADSKQVYAEIPIITAQPTMQEKQEALHALYGIMSVRTACSVAQWVEMVRIAIDRAHQDGNIPLVVGGTGLYMKTLMEGISLIPATSDEVKQKVQEEYKKLGREAFFALLTRKDPQMAERLKKNDSARVIRAYEVMEQTGRSLAQWQKVLPVAFYKKEDFLCYFLAPDKDVVYRRCDDRFEVMIKGGVIEEVDQVNQMHLSESLPALKAHGIPEIRQYLRGEISKEAAIATAKLNTRHYIKRQFTWFRHQMKDALTINPVDAVAIKQDIRRFCGR